MGGGWLRQAWGGHGGAMTDRQGLVSGGREWGLFKSMNAVGCRHAGPLFFLVITFGSLPLAGSWADSRSSGHFQANHKMIGETCVLTGSFRDTERNIYGVKQYNIWHFLQNNPGCVGKWVRIELKLNWPLVDDVCKWVIDPGLYYTLLSTFAYFCSNFLKQRKSESSFTFQSQI